MVLPYTVQDVPLVINAKLPPSPSDAFLASRCRITETPLLSTFKYLNFAKNVGSFFNYLESSEGAVL